MSFLTLSLSKGEGKACYGTRQKTGAKISRGIGVSAYVYILRCRDGRYYVGSTRGDLEGRVGEHNSGVYGGFTQSRRPVELVFHQEFERITDAIAAERQIKGWSRAKKEALIDGDFGELVRLARNRTEHPHPSTSSG